MTKKQKIILIELIAALVFVLLSHISHPTLHKLYQSYFADIIIPFSFYFLLYLLQLKTKPLTKALIIFLLCSLSEVLQYFKIFALARIFDPFDFIAYGIGSLTALTADTQVFKFSKNKS